MTNVKVTPEAQSDIHRLIKNTHDKHVAGRALEAVKSAILTLKDHPLIGKKFNNDPDLSEKIVPFGKTGYTVLYHYDAFIDEVIILAVRHQREAGY